jgi:hypothetical protein
MCFPKTPPKTQFSYSGGLNPSIRPDLMEPQGKPRKAKIVLDRTTFVALDFQCTLPTHGPFNHGGGIRVNQKIQPTI